MQQLPVGIQPSLFTYYCLNATDGYTKNILFAIVIAACLEIQQYPFFIPPKSRDEDKKDYDENIKQIREKYFDRFIGRCDFSTYLKLFCTMMFEVNNLKSDFLTWSWDNHMNNKTLREWRSTYARILTSVRYIACVDSMLYN